MTSPPQTTGAKYLIVNGDDFGAGRGVNRGVVQAYRRGILTSASLIVNMAASAEAARLARDLTGLSVGLHVNLSDERGPSVDAAIVRRCQNELNRQLEAFLALMARMPTHIDSHHNVHRDPQLLPRFLDVAQRHGLPLREHSNVRYYSHFYGQWDGITHIEHVMTSSLTRMLRDDIGPGVTELSCHPGYVDADFVSVYAAEREAELETLCDPAVRVVLEECSIQLVSFADLPSLTATEEVHGRA